MKQHLFNSAGKVICSITFLFIFFFPVVSFSQLVVTGGGTPTTIINNLVGAGLTVSNVTLNCGISGPTSRYGVWNGVASNLGMPNGVILTTGEAASAIGPNTNFSTTGGPASNQNTYVDPQLTSISPNATNDVCILEFDVVPHCTSIQLRFVFGSEEYTEYSYAPPQTTIFNDAFGFFVTGPGGPNCSPNFFNNTNVAVLPNGTPVSIGSINNGNSFGCPMALPGPCTNCAYYINNCGCVAANCIQYDGFTVPITVTLNVCACQTYHWKFIIADATDHAYDSGIFLDYLNSCNSPLVYNIVPTPAVCGCNGQATVNVTTGVPPFSYIWSNGQTTQTATGLCPGNYTVSVTDGISCNLPVTQQIVITGSPSPVVVSLTSQINEICFGDTTGSAIINPSGGASPYSYLWSTTPPQTTQNAWNLAAGNYSVIVTDINGCADTLPITITEPPQLTVAFNTFTHTTCNINNGSITPTYAGGTGIYSYIWNTTPPQAIASINNLAPGIYTVTVTDANNCSATGSFTINPSAAVIVTTSPDVTICSGQMTTLTANGAVNYNWSPATGLSSTTGNSVDATPTSSTLYQVIGQDALGCLDTAYINVTVNPLPVLVLTPQAVSICDGQSTPLNVGGASSYTWSPATGLSSTTGSLVTANPSLTTTYTVVGDLLGCLDSAQVTVTVNPMPFVSYTPVFSDGCAPVTVQFTDGTVTPVGSNYFWDFDGNGTSSQQNPLVVFTQPGNYTVTLTVTAPGGCSSSFSVSAVDVYAQPVASFVIAPLSSFIGRVISFYDQTTPAGGTWNWNFGDNSGTSVVQNPTYTYTDTGTYTVSLIIITPDGCMDSASSTILIRDFEFALYAPNVFTPNGDGINDIFMTNGIGVDKFEMTIYDRWGIQVFQTNNWGDAWNGQMNDSGEKCQMGVYVYTINAWDNEGRVNHYVGKVTLLR